MLQHFAEHFEAQMKLKDRVTVRDGALQQLLASVDARQTALATPQAEENVQFDVLYECDAYAVINKPYDLTVHPAVGNEHGTLVNGLLHRFGGAAGLSSGDGQSARPGIVHRLDRHTSGVMVVARTL